MLAGNQIAHRNLRIDEILIIRSPTQHSQRLSGRCTVIMMYGQVIHGIVALVQNRFVPVREMLHKRSGRTADSGFNGLINPFHCLGNLIAFHTVSPGILIPGAKLPWTVHLISEIPGFHTVGLLMSVFAAQIRPPGTAFMIGVFHNIHCITDISRSQIDCIERFRSYFFCPLQIFIMPYLIGNNLVPCGIQTDFTLCLGTDGILPVPGGHEITARQTACRHIGLF